MLILLAGFVMVIQASSHNFFAGAQSIGDSTLTERTLLQTMASGGVGAGPGILIQASVSGLQPIIQPIDLDGPMGQLTVTNTGSSAIEIRRLEPGVLVLPAGGSGSIRGSGFTLLSSGPVRLVWIFHYE